MERNSPLGVLAPLVILFAWAICAGCKPDEVVVGCPSEDPREVKTQSTLLLVAESARIAAWYGDAMPRDLQQFSAWVADCDPAIREMGLFNAEGVLVDGWGKELVLCEENGVLVGLGSCGKDGVWEGGGGDDMMIGFYRSAAQTGPSAMRKD